MSKSIRISSELAAAAESAALLAHRSPPQQIEHWAHIGRVLEPALAYQAGVAVKQVQRADLDSVLEKVSTPEAIQRTQTIIRRNTGTIASTDR
jgi:hypothetical protein